MFMVGLLSWWYTSGIKRAVGKVGARFAGLLDYFSIDLLARTLFSPFRQISAGSVDGPIDAQLRAWADRTISRVIGAIVRTIVIVVGCLAIIAQGIASCLYLLLWVGVPLLPFVGLVMMLVGWMPWTLTL